MHRNLIRQSRPVTTNIRWSWPGGSCTWRTTRLATACCAVSPAANPVAASMKSSKKSARSTSRWSCSSGRYLRAGHERAAIWCKAEVRFGDGLVAARTAINTCVLHSHSVSTARRHGGAIAMVAGIERGAAATAAVVPSSRRLPADGGVVFSPRSSVRARGTRGHCRRANFRIVLYTLNRFVRGQPRGTCWARFTMKITKLSRAFARTLSATFSNFVQI